jgi:hypothetical protein
MPNSTSLNPDLSSLLADTCSNAIASFKVAANGEKKQHSFEIDCRDLDKSFHSNDIRDSKEFKEIFDTLNPITKPVLYWFEIISDTSHQEIVESILKYKKEDGTRATPAMKKNTDDTSRTLYVGKVKSFFWGRLITHLGYLKGTGQTQGLQLDCWAKDICLKQRLNVIEFDKSMADYMTVVEYAFAKELKPIIGKHK